MKTYVLEIWDQLLFFNCIKLSNFDNAQIKKFCSKWYTENINWISKRNINNNYIEYFKNF